jgi:hypothetical protein
VKRFFRFAASSQIADREIFPERGTDVKKSCQVLDCP